MNNQEGLDYIRGYFEQLFGQRNVDALDAYLDPQYFDAHYNLALVYDRVHSYPEACHHWEIYLKYDSGSRWARYARDRVHEITRLVTIKQEK